MKTPPRNLVTLGVTVTALTLGSVVAERLPTATQISVDPIVRTAGQGEPVTLRTGTFTVTGVRASPQVKGVAYGPAHKATGRYVAIDVEVLALGEPRFVATSSARLVATDGRSFGGPLADAPVCPAYQPGVIGRCTLLFDVDPQALSGMTLQLPAQDDFVGLGPAILERADIDLGIDEARAATLAAATGTLDLTDGAPR